MDSIFLKKLADKHLYFYDETLKIYKSFFDMYEQCLEASGMLKDNHLELSKEHLRLSELYFEISTKCSEFLENHLKLAKEILEINLKK